MSFRENSINSFKDLFAEIKVYFDLQKEYGKVEITEKLSALISMMVLGGVIMIFCTIALLYLSLGLTYIIASYVGGMAWSFMIMAGALFFILFIVYLNRKRWIFNPIINFVAKLFLNDSK